MTLFGIIIQGGQIKSAAGKRPSELLAIEDACVVMFDDVNERIYLWAGPKADVKSRFLASRLASVIKLKRGGVGSVVQNKDEILRELAGKDAVDQDIPPRFLSAIR